MFNVGDLVTINITRNQDYGVVHTGTMVEKSGSVGRIRSILPGVFRGFQGYSVSFPGDQFDDPWTWTEDMFLEWQMNQVTEEDELKNDGLTKSIYSDFVKEMTKDEYKVGTFCYFIAKKAKLYKITSVTSDGEYMNIINVDEAYSRFEGAYTVRKRDIVIPDDAELLTKFGVTNGTLKNIDIPEFFKNSKYPIAWASFEQPFRSKDGKKTITKKRAQYVYIVKKPENYGEKATIIAVIDGKCRLFTDIDANISYDINPALNIGDKLADLCSARIIKIDDSVELFGNKGKKVEMLEEAKTNKKLYPITNLILGYDPKKTGEGINVIELNTGTIKLKFKLSDIEVVLPNLNGITLPKDRIIRKGTICKIIRDKQLPISKNQEVEVLEIMTKQVSNKGSTILGSITTAGRSYVSKSTNKGERYDKNTIVKVATVKDKQIFKCRIKNLKKLNEGIKQKEIFEETSSKKVTKPKGVSGSSKTSYGWGSWDDGI